MIKAIIFDFDGVIVESVDIKTNAFAKLFESEGQEVVKKIVDYHLRNTGVSRYDKFKYIYNRILKRPLANTKFQELCNRFTELVVEEVVKAPYVKGAKEFLDNWSSKYNCYIISATPQKEIEEIIQRRKMTKFFKSVYGASMKKKEAVRGILTRERIGSQSALYIGDAKSDYLAAKANLVNFIARIKDNEFVFAGTPCLKIRDLNKLNKIVRNL